MALDPDLAHRRFATPAPYDVSAERIAEFSRAVGWTGDDGVAAFTFPLVVAFALMTQLMSDPDVGIDLHNVVHRDQRIDQVRPIVAGDRLSATLVIDSVRSAAGVDLIVTRTDIRDQLGEPVSTATATLVHRAGASAGGA